MGISGKQCGRKAQPNSAKIAAVGFCIAEEKTMDLDDFKTTWQSSAFLTEAKEMNDIQKMVQKNTAVLVGRIAQRYGRITTSSLIGAVAFIILFYTISDGFRESPMGLW